MLVILRRAVVARLTGGYEGRDIPEALGAPLIFITAKFTVLPEHADDWPEIARDFTQATRAEDGCLWFEWARCLDDPHAYLLTEAFRDGDAGGAHVGSDHFKAAQEKLPDYLAATPQIVSTEVDQDDWNELGELRVER